MLEVECYRRTLDRRPVPRVMAGTPFGKYLLFDRIAAGGMAEIYRAKYVAVAGVTKNVVIKKILPHYAGNKNFVAMFVNEAKIAVGLSHGNIAQIFDFGEIDGEYYLAMEYVDGPTLSRLSRRAKERSLRIPVPFAVFIAMEVCRGLQYAHTRVDDLQRPLNIVHRDISPQNVILSFEGQIKIVDFGIAKVRIAGAEAEKTQAGAIKGKYVYFSPEQARARDLDARTDVFATGIVLYEMLCGRLPFEGKMIEVLNKIVRGDFARPSTLNPDISPALEEIILKAMAIDREKRYPSALAFQEALAEHLYSISPKFSQASLAELVAYLFGDELAAEGRQVQVPQAFLDQVPGWRVDAVRSTEVQTSSGGEIRTSAARRRAMELAEGRDDETPVASNPGLSTASAFREPRQRYAVATGLFLLTAALAGVAVVWFGGKRPAKHPSLAPSPVLVPPLPKSGTTADLARDAGGPPLALAPPLKGDDGVDAPTSLPTPLLAAYPQLDLQLAASGVSIPASHAARVRLDPTHAYLLSVEGTATLDHHHHPTPARGCFYFVERADGTHEPTFGFVGPRDVLRLVGVSVLYGFVVDDAPASNHGALVLKAAATAGGEVVRLKVDAQANAVFPDARHGARFSGLPGKDRLELELTGALEPDAAQGRPSRAVYWYERGGSGPTALVAGDVGQGVAKVGEHAKLETPTQVVLFVPDDDASPRGGALSASLRPSLDDKANAKPHHGR